ncbi:MAG: sirohydrochlorin cobaltochelatase [Nitrososphaera sp.]|nr:sirohydrochlorin cobaltochelatase [Nitrososphaera sp.]
MDRGSREPEVRDELREICSIAKKRGQYDYTDYCFLEVLPPFIHEGIDRCVSGGANSITVMPYFLYPGMKLKETVKRTALIGKERHLKMVITKPLSYHPMMAQLIRERIDTLKKEKGIQLPDKDCDVVLIGHGSSDKNAHDAFVHAARSIEPNYHQVHHSFLELDDPNIELGIAQAVSSHPKIILIMPYFLHRGAHIKTDVIRDVTAALEKCGYENAFMSRHLGVDEKLVDLVIERALEVEGRAGF